MESKPCYLDVCCSEWSIDKVTPGDGKLGRFKVRGGGLARPEAVTLLGDGIGVLAELVNGRKES